MEIRQGISPPDTSASQFLLRRCVCSISRREKFVYWGNS